MTSEMKEKALRDAALAAVKKKDPIGDAEKLAEFEAKRKKRAERFGEEDGSKDYIPPHKRAAASEVLPSKDAKVAKVAGGGRWGEEDSESGAAIEGRTSTTYEKIMAAVNNGGAPVASGTGAGSQDGGFVDSDDELEAALTGKPAVVAAAPRNVPRRSSIPQGRQADGSVGEYIPSLYGCRSVEAYTKLNAIAEGTYGKVISRVIHNFET